MILPDEQRGLTILFDEFSHGVLRQSSQGLFGKEFGALELDEAARLIGAYFVKNAQSEEEGRVKVQARFTEYATNAVVIDSMHDGQVAMRGFMRQLAREISPRIDDELRLVVCIRKERTFWDKVFRRPSTYSTIYDFQNQPPNYEQ